jgi:hypothetical protein
MSQQCSRCHEKFPSPYYFVPDLPEPVCILCAKDPSRATGSRPPDPVAADDGAGDGASGDPSPAVRRGSTLYLIGGSLGLVMLTKDCVDATRVIPGPPSHRLAVLLHSPVGIAVGLLYGVFVAVLLRGLIDRYFKS